MMQTSLRAVCRSLTALTMVGGLAMAGLTPVDAAPFRGGGGFHGGGHGGFGGYRGGYGGFRGGYGFGYRGCCYGGYYGGFGFGEALLGAAIIGGTAAVIASEPVYETYPAPVYPAYPPPVAVAPGYGYAPPPAPAEQGYRSTDPVDACSRAAIDEASSRGDSGRVSRIDHVDPYQNGARVIGTLEVRRADRNGAVENARFTCTANYGQVTSFRFG